MSLAPTPSAAPLVPPRSGVLDIAPYVAGASRLPGHATVYKLASNEAALGPSPKAVEAFRAAAGDLHLYPDPRCETLRGAIADTCGLDPEQLIFGNGSEALLDILVRAYAGPGEEVLFPALSFPLYRILTMSAGAVPVEARAPGFTADVDALLDAVTPATRIVILANPNNPTGTWIPGDEVKRLRAGLREDILLIIDSAYGEYPDDASYSDGADIVAAHPDNTVMTRTFSKMYALASARVGWAYAGLAIIRTMERLRLVFCVGAQAEAAAVAALRDTAHVAAEKAHCILWRGRMEERLSALGFVPVPGAGNFVFVPVPDWAGGWRGLDERLKQHGVIARPIPPANALRISVGPEGHNQAFLKALEGLEALAEAAGARASAVS